MTSSEIIALSALELGQAIKEGRTTSPEAVDAYLEKIAAEDGRYHSYITVLADEARARAAEVQAKIEAGELTGPLAGVPVALKDNLCTKGLLTTCASKILYNFRPPYTATAVQKLLDAGAVILGKANMDEFAMGSTTETSYFGPTGNPADPDHVPGGSSGGSAAAVGAELAPYALGTDTGGSIRQPASYCGVVGMKPTYGAVSRYGLIAYGSSLDQIGPLARTVSDCAAVLETIAGHDERDATSASDPAIDMRYTEALVRDVKGMKIGIPSSYFGEGLDREVKDAIFAAAEVLRAEGAEVEEFDLPMVDYAIPAYYVIAMAECSSNLSRFDGVKYGYRTERFEDLQDIYKRSRSEGFGTEVKRRLMIGAFVLSSGYYDAYYNKALKVRACIKQAFDEAFAKYDAILAPAAPTTAPKKGESLSDPLKMYLSDIYTVSVNLAGLPGITVPVGKDSKGLPIGMQILGNTFCDKTIIRAAYTYEQAAKDDAAEGGAEDAGQAADAAGSAEEKGGRA